MGSRRHAVGFRAATGRARAVATSALVALVALGALVVCGTPASPSAAAASAATPVGNDISFPQCGSRFPSGQDFGIVGINDGVPGTLNPCVGTSSSYPAYADSELYWAVSTSTGTGGQPRASVYVNTSDPGSSYDGAPVSSWPASGSTPYGACTTTTLGTGAARATVGQNSTACAWEFGDKEAAQDASLLQAAANAIDAQAPPVSVPSAPSAYPWWLDVETTNTWRQQAAGEAMNVAVLQGFVVGLRAAGATKVGVYASPYQWTAITGGTTASTATLGGIPAWIPGASNETGADDVCGGSSFTAGAVAIAQFPSGVFDGDLSCKPTSAPAPVSPPGVAQIYGQTADATAAAELTRAFPYAKGSCPPTHVAVLASTAEYQDALSGQFLAAHFTTGTLLSPTTSLPAVTATALREEGIKVVYLVGAPLAAATAVATAIGNLTAYACGGKTHATGKIAVHSVYGQTPYATAMQVAELVGTAGQRAFPGAYGTTNAAGGSGKYNDTAGNGTAAPFDPLEPTAILANGVEFQDAQAASVVSYHTELPLLLTPASTLSTTAVAAIEKLGVKQVVLMGGTLAITGTVEQALVAKTGVSVLRVAGQDYTDTARELARFESADATAGLGWTPGHRVLVARGDGSADGLCGAVLDNSRNTTTGPQGTTRPLLLTESPTAVGTYLTTFLEATGHEGIDSTSAKTVTTLVVLGGLLAVSAAEIAEMQADLKH